MVLLMNFLKLIKSKARIIAFYLHGATDQVISSASHRNKIALTRVLRVMETRRKNGSYHYNSNSWLFRSQHGRYLRFSS